MKILVVDDSATMRQQIRMVLESANYEVVEAVDGADGLEQLLKTSGFSLVFCDVNMPRLNGVEMVKEAVRAGIQVPIVMLTTEGQPAVAQQSREAGAKGWIVKPFKGELLISVVRKLAVAPTMSAV